MPVTTDFHYRLSGGAANTAALASIGGAKSSSVAPAALFDRVEAAEATAGDVEYRCIYPHNAGTAGYTGVKLWVLSDTAEASTTIEVGIGTSALNGVEQTVASESIAPVGVTFSAAATKAAGVDLGALAAGDSRAVWIRRTVAAAAPAASAAFSLRIEGETV